MLLAVTQSQAIVNLSSFKIISINKTEDGDVYILTDDNIILGKYSLEEALKIIPWMASEIGDADSNKNIAFTMPMSVSLLKKEESNEN